MQKPIPGHLDDVWDVPYVTGFVDAAGTFLTRLEAYQRGLDLGRDDDCLLDD